MNQPIDLEGVLRAHFRDAAATVPIERRFDEIVSDHRRESNSGPHSRSRKLLTFAAGLVVLVGIGALATVLRSSEPGRLDLPTVCEPGVDLTDQDDVTPRLDRSANGFLVALPADSSIGELVVRALLNPRSGPDCLAYDPARITIRPGDTDDHAEASISLREGDTVTSRLRIERTAFLLGITEIQGISDFTSTTDANGTTLTIENLPDRATTVSVRFDTASGTSSVTVPAAAADRIELLDELDNDRSPVRLVPRFTFNVFDDDGDILDIGGLATSLPLPLCGPATSTDCLAEVESLGSEMLTGIALDLGRTTELEAGVCTTGGRGDDAITLCAVPVSDGRTALFGDPKRRSLTLNAATRRDDVIAVPFPPARGVAVVIATGSGAYDVIDERGETVLSMFGSPESELDIGD